MQQQDNCHPLCHQSCPAFVPRALLATLTAIMTLVATQPCWAADSLVACPAWLKQNSSPYLPAGESRVTLCTLHQRFEAAKSSLKTRGIGPAHRLADAMAPRFINGPTWQSQGPLFKYSPWHVYDPAPLTWLKWEQGARLIERTASVNKQKNRFFEVNKQYLMQLHKASLGGIIPRPGEIRKVPAYGPEFDRASALQVETIQELRKFHVTGAGSPVLEWIALKCFDEFSEQQKQDFENTKFFDPKDYPHVQNAEYFQDAKGLNHQCGSIVYLASSQINSELSRWLRAFKTTTDQIYASKQGDFDLILEAAAFQRWFIAIHPFESGNGRLSRYLMDLLFISVGLPAPILENMNDDLFLSDQQWARKIGQGLVRAVEVYERCGKTPKAPGCNLVSFSPERKARVSAK